MNLVWYDIQLCRDSKSATYLVFDKVKVRLAHEGTDLYEPRTEATRMDEPSGHQLAISGLYRTTGSVSVFNGMALRFAEGKCAIVFLAGMPEQDFRYSISTELSRMQPFTTRGITCYKLNNENVRDDLHRASTLQKKLGGPGNLSPETVFPCVLNGGVLMMAGGSTYPMRMVSGDPYKSLELPLQPPRPGVYVNDYPVAGLDSVTVAVDTDGSFSVKVAIIGRTEVTLLGRTFQSADPLQRCFRDVTPHVQSITILLAAKDSSTKLMLDDVKLCRDSWLVTYIVLGDTSIRLKEFSHPENTANKIRLGRPAAEASTRSQVVGQDKPPISNPKPTGESIIGEASQGNGDSPDLGSLLPSSVTKRPSPGPRNGSPGTGDENVQQLLPVRKEEASALNPEPKKKLIILPVFSVSPSSAGGTLPSGLALGGFPRPSGDSAELRDQQKDTLKPKREPLAAVVSALSGSHLHIDSLLPLPVPQRSPSGPGREGFPRVSGEAGKVRILRQAEPSALNDGSGAKAPLAGRGSSGSGNLPELNVLLPSRRVELVHAARTHKTVTGRSLGPAEDLQASMERGSLVKPSTHPHRPRSTALQSETDGARAIKRQKSRHTASISHGLAERKPGKVRPHTENTGKHGGEKSDFGPTTSAIKARESASGGGHHGFGYSHKARFPTGAVGKPSGSSQVRSLRRSDEESNLKTQLSMFDSKIPEWSTTPTETRGVGMVPDFGASFVPPNVTWSDLLSPEPGVSVTAPSGAGEEPGGLSIDEQLAIESGGLLDFLDPDKQ
ncbi:hypothetical protein FOZ63_031816 [Perkinsus olseni]|uniref:Uncharacterized protein n=1 Tax=Perkinsus olseni TaxID=32597 RepID=A0A7J6TJW3_PEROL|nr:hypothetical protein FOZ62_029997 [Perkinsus olseni]KAF4756262.1 hypothetical protein FOZ63_031816 [Perkinsus olseni]